MPSNVPTKPTPTTDSDGLKHGMSRNKSKNTRRSAAANAVASSDIVSLLDGVRPLVEIWQAETPAQKVWKDDWLRRQLKAINDFERKSRNAKLIVKQPNTAISQPREIEMKRPNRPHEPSGQETVK